ncbi:hypothetical protein FH972_021207 [Carpinus fangiana]|uniref:GRAM domain-containing protein n=1 Tax=Carpinus fangiana TaxID=176857 RepID=A0A5N6KPA0_9ROSI|nr:hypothetical protein FH972_021207 [Carpinus fangiana]
MSINWVMLDPRDGFTPLSGEQKLWTSPPRTSFSIQSMHQYPGKDPFSISSSSGRVYLTNRRIVYLPATATPTFQSFNGPLLNLHDTHVTTPWLGPNAWIAAVQPVPNGGIPSTHAAVELKLTFRDGGAYDFHTKFVAIRERLQQAVEVARESGQSSQALRADRNGATGMGGASVDLNSVHLDQLPAYEETAPGSAPIAAPASTLIPVEASSTSHNQNSVGAAAAEAAERRETARAPPAEPPPGYEEVQRQGVAERLERDLRSTQ